MTTGQKANAYHILSLNQNARNGVWIMILIKNPGVKKVEN